LIGINLSNLRKLDPVVLGRVMQNIEICRKHKTRMAVFSDAQSADELPSPQDVQSLLLVLGMSTKQAAETMRSLEFSHSLRREQHI
jgi:RNase P/RNase MRP subunit p30